jgi:Tfp pilus assembly protein PilF
MVKLRFLILAWAIFLAACSSDYPKIRPLALDGNGAALTRFDQHYEAGKASLRNNRVGLALVLFEKALAIEPRSVAALNAIGAAYDELHHPALAAAYYAQALALEPRSADTLNNMAVSAMLAGKIDRARELFEAALDIDAANARIRANIALFDEAAGIGAAATPQPLRPRPDRLSIERIGPAAFRLRVPMPPPFTADGRPS